MFHMSQSTLPASAIEVDSRVDTIADSRLEKAVSVRKALQQRLRSRDVDVTSSSCAKGYNEDAFLSLMDKQMAQSPHARRLWSVWGRQDAQPKASLLTNRTSPLQRPTLEEKQDNLSSNQNWTTSEYAHHSAFDSSEEYQDSHENVELSGGEAIDNENVLKQTSEVNLSPLSPEHLSTSAFLKRCQNRIIELEQELENKVSECTVINERCVKAEESGKTLASDYWSLHERVITAEEKGRGLDDMKEALHQCQRKLREERDSHLHTSSNLSDTLKQLKELEVTASVVAAKQREKEKMVAESEAREVRRQLLSMGTEKEEAVAKEAITREELSTERKRTQLLEGEIESRQEIVDEVNQRCRELEIVAEQKTSDFERIEKQIEMMKKEYDIAHNESLSREASISQKLKDEIEQKTKFSNAVLKLETQLNSENSEHERLTKEIERMSKLLNEANVLRDAETDKVLSLQNELAESLGKVDALEKDIQDVSKEMEEVSLEKMTITESYENALEDLQSLQSSCDRLAMENSEMKEKMESMSDDVNTRTQKHQDALLDMKEDHMKAMNALRMKHSEQEAHIRKEFEDRLMASKEEFERMLSSNRNSSEAMMESLRVSSAREIEMERELHERELQQRTSSSNKELKLAQEKLDEHKQKSKAIIEKLNADLSQSKLDHHTAEKKCLELSNNLEDMENDHERRVSVLTATHVKEKDLLDEELNSLKKQCGTIQNDLERQLSLCNEQIAREKVIFETSLAECEEQHGEALAKQHAEHIHEVEALKMQIQTLESGHLEATQSSAFVKQLNESLESLEAENKTLSAEIEKKVG